MLFTADELHLDGSLTLTDHRAEHIRKVLRAEVGDSVRVGMLDGLMGTGSIQSITEQSVVLAVGLSEPPPASSGIDLIVALPRPKVARKLLAAAPTLGIRRLVFVNARRVERSYFDSPLLSPEGIREELLVGLSQARDTRLPEVLIRPQFRPFIEDEVAALWPAPVQRLMPHPTARQSIRALPPPGPCVAAIGPEGGWIPFEADFLATHGFEPLTFGPRILRVETAIPFIVGQILALRS